MIRDGARLCELRDEGIPRAVVDKSFRRKRRQFGVRRIGGIAEDLLQIWVCGKSAVGRIDARRRERPDEDTLPDRLEQARERVCTGLRGYGASCFRDK